MNVYQYMNVRTQIFTKYFMKYVMQSVCNLKFALDLWKVKRVNKFKIDAKVIYISMIY